MSSLGKYFNTSAIGLAVTLILLSYWLWSRRRFYTLALKMPGHLGWPFFGNFPSIKHIDYFFPSIENFFEKSKSHTTLNWFGTHPIVLTRDPVVVEKILTSQLWKSPKFYASLQDFLLGGGLVTVAGSRFRSHRKMLNPSFKQSVLLSFFPVFNKTKYYMISQFEEHSKSNRNNEVNALKIIQKTIIKVATETIMGRKDELEERVIEKYLASYVIALKRLFFHGVLAYLNVWKLMKLDLVTKKSKTHMNGFVHDHIKDKLEQENQKTSVADSKSDDEDRIMIDQLFHLWRQGKFSWYDVVSESNTMMIASMETTSNALYSAVLMLAMHHPVQQKLYEELTSVFSGKDISVESEHLSKLPYLDMVVQETLRLAPSIPVIARQVTEEIDIGNGVILPQGTQVVLPIFHLHRNKDVWGPNAHKFDPDNFLPGKKEHRHPYAYVPFSKGLRNCIGFQYAIFSLRVMLISLVYFFEFDTDVKYEDLQIVSYMTLAYKRPPHIKVKPRFAR